MYIITFNFIYLYMFHIIVHKYDYISGQAYKYVGLRHPTGSTGNLRVKKFS